MSGTKQHYIPQLILRRFGTKHPKREKTQVWVYPKGSEAFFAATDGVAAKRFFYSALSPGEETLDDRITDHENAVTADLAAIDTAPDDAVPGDAAARVIAHLTVRSAHVRDIFSKAGELMAGEGLELFKDPAWTARAIGLDQDGLTPTLQAMVREELSKIPGAEAMLSTPGMSAALHSQMKTIFAQMQPEIVANVTAFQSQFAEELSDLVKSSHVKALDKSLAPEPRVELLRTLTWTVRTLSSSGLVLPDCVALAKVADMTNLIPAALVSRESKIEAVFLPLDPNRLLVGSPVSVVDLPADWNSAAAGASEHFFIAPAKDKALVDLAPTIGRVVSAFLEKELRPAFAADPQGLLDR